MNRANDPEGADFSRRRVEHCFHEEDWGALKTTVENLDRRINGSLQAIQKHMDDGQGWRIAIVGIVISIVMQIGGFLYLWGGMSKQVEINTKKSERIELIIDRMKEGSHAAKVQT